MSDQGSFADDFFKSLFEATPHPYLILGADPSFPILAVNERYLAATGTQRDVIVGHGLFEIFPDNPKDGAVSGVSDLRASLGRVMEDLRPDTMGVQKYDIPLRDGSDGFEVRYWSPVNTPVCNVSGELAWIIHHVEDVTEFILQQESLRQAPTEDPGRIRDGLERMEAEVMRRSAEVKEANRALKTALEELESSRKALAAMNDRLSEMDKLKSDFFANISHGLRTPLTLILGPLSQHLREPRLDPELRADMERMERNARILLARVNDLLDLAKLDAGRMSLHLVEVDLAQAVRLEASRFESLAEELGITLTVVAPGPLPARVDLDKVRRILANLLANACKFTPAGGEIQVVLGGAEGVATLEVADSGPGVPESMRTLVFDRFQQVEEGPAHRQDGTGLGLAIVKAFTALHDGSVTLETSRAGGALFQVKLPLKTSGSSPVPHSVEADASELSERHQWIPRVAPRAWAGPDPAAAHVLVVEDNADMRDFLAHTLSQTYHVATAENGEDGLRQALADLPDLVITDVMMPGMRGDQLVEELRARPATEDLPIILLTAKADEALRVKMLNLGVGDYLFKPFSFDELLARVGALLEARQKGRLASQSQENRFRAIFDQANVGIAQVSPDGLIVTANARLCQILGYSREALVGKHLMDLTPPHESAQTRQRLQALLGGDVSTPSEEKLHLRRDGNPVWVAQTLSLVRDGQGRPDYFVWVIQDIQARKDAELARQEADAALLAAQTRQLEMERELNHLQRLESIGRLAGGVAHDINNVLAAIMAVASVFELKCPESSEEAKLAGLILDAAGRGKNLVRGLTDFARKEVQGMVAVDLNQLVRREADLLEHTTLKRVEIQLDLEEGLPEIQGEPASLATALMNLCVNACDAMPQGGTLRLTTRTLPLGSVELAVQDTGEGMPQEIMNRAMEPFFTTKAPGKGTGLGLSIVFGTIKAHGGTISLQSRPGEGTRITWVLPIPPAHPATASPAVPGAPRPQRSLTLLLVDDDEDIRNTLPVLLGAQGHEVVVATGAHDAADRLRDGLSVDLVILDMNMPGLNGLATLERLRGIHPDLPVLMASGHLDPATVAAASHYPRVLPLTKPFTVSELQQALASFFPGAAPP